MGGAKSELMDEVFTIRLLARGELRRRPDHKTGGGGFRMKAILRRVTRHDSVRDRLAGVHAAQHLDHKQADHRPRPNTGRLCAGIAALVLSCAAGAYTTPVSGQELAPAAVVASNPGILATDPNFLVTNPGLLATAINQDDYWMDLGRQDCNLARARAFSDAKGSPYNATQRYEGARAWQSCIESSQTRTNALIASAANNPNAAQALLTTQLLLDDEKKKSDDEVEEKKGPADFLGWKFGAALGVSFGGESSVTDAEKAADGTLRAKKTETDLPRVILETHSYKVCEYLGGCKEGNFGIGPFIAAVVSPGNDSLLSFGLGVMFGWRDGLFGGASPTNSSTPADSQGFSIGVGALLDSNVKTLASGYEVGKPLPEGETEIKYQEETQWRFMLIVSRTF